MVFGIVVAVIVVGALALMWRHDRRHRGSVDIDQNSPGSLSGRNFATERHAPHIGDQGPLGGP